MRPQSAKRRKDMQTYRWTMTAAMRYAGLASLLALSAATSSFAQSRTEAELDSGSSYYCAPKNPDEQKVYCEDWRLLRKDW